MRFYEFMVEGIFIQASGLGADVGGFQATFFIKSSNVATAVDRMRRVLSDRMSAHFVATVETGVFRTYFCIRDVWEVAEERMFEFEGRDLGFTFFRIGKVECMYLAFRRVLLRMFRPQSVFFPHRTA